MNRFNGKKSSQDVLRKLKKSSDLAKGSSRIKVWAAPDLEKIKNESCFGSQDLKNF